VPLRLPLFQLDVVLFPSVELPLHVFEPRYRALLTDVLAGDQRFGVVPAGPRSAPPEPGAIGCVARIVTHQPLAEGRSNIVVVGESRFVLRGLLDDTAPYPVGLVDAFDDDEDSAELPVDMTETLRHLGERCRTALRVLTDHPGGEPWAGDPATLTFQIAGALPWGTEQGRRLLALRSPAQRAELLLRVLPRIVPDLEGRADIHRQAGRNGKGHHPPEWDSGS
jgi:Lon protease-like protein